MTWRAGIDVMSFGGTKNGCMGVEAVVIFDPAKAWEFELRRKRGGHLFSKHRFLSAQMAAYLDHGLWLVSAQPRQPHGRASGPRHRSPARRQSLMHPCEGNIVFASFPRALHKKATAAGGHYYLWPFDQTLEGPDDGLAVGALRLFMVHDRGGCGRVPRLLNAG
jgi:threonine aldolase